MLTKRLRRALPCAVLVCALVAAGRDGGEARAGRPPGSEKYQAALYPHGLPSRQNPLSGATETVEYRLYDEARLPGLDAVAIVYSERVGPLQADGAYKVYLAILTGRGRERGKAAVADLTDFIPVWVEFPGNFMDMDARLNTLDLAGRPALHVNLWGVLAGTGHLNGATDVFFRVGDDLKPELALALKGTSRFSRAGLGNFELKDYRLYLTATPEGRPRLLVRTRAVAREGGRPQKDETTVSSYVLGEKTFELEKADPGELAGLLAAAGRPLPRSHNVVSEPPAS